jgi:uncharacterized repeat protein (TIGR04002 family)
MKETKNLVLSSLFAGIITITTAYFLHIPIGGNGGFIHIGDSFLYLAASILPRFYAIFCVAIGFAFSDILTGSINWLISTIIIKPILVLFFTSKEKYIINKRNIFGGILSGIIGTFLYMLFDAIMYGSFVSAFFISIISLIQPIGSFIVFLLIGKFLDNINFKNKISK